MYIFYLIKIFVIFFLFFNGKINFFSLKIYTFYTKEIYQQKKPPLLRVVAFTIIHIHT
jgi:hypothetical protein